MDVNSENHLSPRNNTQYVAKSRWRKHWKRSLGLAHGRRQSELYKTKAEGKSLLNQAKYFLEIYFFKWVWHYIKSRFGGKWAFQDYNSLSNDNGIYNLTAQTEQQNTNDVYISLIGDWGSGTKDAFEVAEVVKQDSPHFTIHLGDIYYVATKGEVQENMLGDRVQWPAGRCGSFALNANHEMYARGKAYFKYLLPALGIRDQENGKLGGQKASYFCLKNEHWLVIGLDTGYYSIGIPIIEMIFKPSAKLHAKQIEWLKNDLRLQDDDQRGIILLSHHQYYSQFESGYNRPAKQLSQLINRPVMWFWGHEHRFSIYGKYSSKNGKLNAYGRCLGHGGLPIEDISEKPKTDRKHEVGLVLYDKREKAKIGDSNTPVGYNGYANLIFHDKYLTVEYNDTEQTLIREKWEVTEGGNLKGLSIDKLIDDSDFVQQDKTNLMDAIT
jgi:hypothetical protein